MINKKKNSENNNSKKILVVMWIIYSLTQLQFSQEIHSYPEGKTQKSGLWKYTQNIFQFRGILHLMISY